MLHPGAAQRSGQDLPRSGHRPGRSRRARRPRRLDQYRSCPGSIHLPDRRFLFLGLVPAAARCRTPGGLSPPWPDHPHGPDREGKTGDFDLRAHRELSRRPAGSATLEACLRRVAMLWCGRYNPGNRKRILASKSDLVSAHTWHLVKRLVREYVRPQRWRMLAALLFMAVLSGCTTALAYLMKPVVDTAFGQHDIGSLYQIA